MFIDLLRKRRSIRKFKDKSIEAGKVELLKESLLRSPSSRGINPWRFYFIDDRDILRDLSLCKEHGSKLIEGAALAVVIGADHRESDVWIEDCSISAITLQYQAENLGLGSCWVQVRNRNHSRNVASEVFIKKLLNLDETINVECVVAIGYADEVKYGHSRESLQDDKIVK